MAQTGLRWGWGAIGLMALATSAWAQDIVIRVPAGGGTTAIMAALKQARVARANLPQDASGAVHIVFPPGEYPVFEPVKLTADDAGTASMPTILEAEVPGKAVWVGALRLRDPVPDTSVRGAWRYSLKGIKHRIEAQDGGQFYVGDRRAVLARMPNLGADWTVQAQSREGSKTQFQLSAEQSAWLQKASPAHRSRALLHVMQSWTSGRHRVIDVGMNGVIRISPDANWPFLQFGAQQRFWVENLPEALDAPGEWLEADDGVLYLPRGEQDRNLTAYLPVNPLLLQIKGRPERDEWVEHVQIKGLSFAYAHHELAGERAQQDWQAEVKVGAAIEVSGARQLSLQDCQILHTGGHALWLRSGVQQVDVQRCLMQDLGAGGIKVGETVPAIRPWQVTGQVRLIDNVINQTGADFPGAEGIWIGPSSGNLVQGNVVANTTHSGISVGWQWGYGEPTASDNDIRDNVLWNIGQGKQADLAGIYTLGRSPGTVIRGNYIRRVRGQPYGAGAWGLYNDEGSSDIRSEGNVVVETGSGSYHLHYGRNLTVSGNYFIWGGGPHVQWTDMRRSGELRVQDNVVVTQGERAWTIPAEAPALQAQGNVLGVAQRKDLSQNCPKGCKPAALMGAQGLASDVAQLDIDGLDDDRRQALRATMKRVGQTVARARKLAGADLFPSPGAADYARPAAVPEQRTAVVALDFDRQSVGGHPGPLLYSPSARPELAQVDVADPSARGPARCLRLLDGDPTLAGFDPHVFLLQRASAGTLTSEFDVWVDEATELVHEWRDEGQPFKSGPIVTLRGDGLLVGGRTLMKWSPRAWYRVKVSARLGGSKDGFDLSVTTPDGQTRRWKLPFAQPDWQDVAWMGWVSATQRSSRTCIGSIKVTQE